VELEDDCPLFRPYSCPLACSPSKFLLQFSPPKQRFRRRIPSWLSGCLVFPLSMFFLTFLNVDGFPPDRVFEEVVFFSGSLFCNLILPNPPCFFIDSASPWALRAIPERNILPPTIHSALYDALSAPPSPPTESSVCDFDTNPSLPSFFASAGFKFPFPAFPSSQPPFTASSQAKHETNPSFFPPLCCVLSFRPSIFLFL